MNPETLYNDIPFLGEPSGRPYERSGRSLVNVDQFRVMTPPRSNGFGYSPPPGGHSIDAIRARRARLEAFTSKLKLPPIVTTGGDVEPLPPEPTSSTISIRSGSGDSRERWTSASLRPSSTKGHPTVPFVPYHNPLPDISREKLVEEEEPMPEAGLDSPPPPTKEDTFKVSRWVEQLPGEAKNDKDDENVGEKESPKDDDIVENLEEEKELSTGRSVFGEALSGKLESEDQVSKISSLQGPEPGTEDIVENLTDQGTKKIETSSFKDPTGDIPQLEEVDVMESDTNSNKGFNHLFTVTRDRESTDEGQPLAETELPVQDIEIEGDHKEELKMIDNTEQLTGENLADSGTQEEEEIQWQKADSIFTVSPASLEHKVLDLEDNKEISSENNHNDIGAKVGENTEVENTVTDITQMSEDKPKDSSEDQVPELEGENMETKGLGNVDERDIKSQLDEVINFSEDQVEDLTGANSDKKDQGNDEENNMNSFSDKLISFSEGQEVELAGLNSDSKKLGNDDESNGNTLSDKVISFSEDQGVELIDLNSDSNKQGNNDENDGNALSDKVISFSEDQGAEITDLNSDSKKLGNDDENEGNTLSDKVIIFSEDQGAELTHLNSDSKQQGNADENEGNTLSDKVISFSDDQGVELTDLNLNSDSNKQGNNDENDGNTALDKFINFQDQELKVGDGFSGTKYQGSDEETKDTNLSDKGNISSENHELTSGIVSLEATNPGENGQIHEALHSGSKSPIQVIESMELNQIENQSMQNPSSRPGSVQLTKELLLKNEADIPEDLKFLEKNIDDSESVNEDTDFITTISPDNTQSGTAEQNEGFLGIPEQEIPAPIKEMGSVSDTKSSDIIEMKEKATLDESIKTSDNIENGYDNKDEDDDKIWDL